MKTQKELYQALLDGKTIVDTQDNIKISLNKDGIQNTFVWFKYPEDWEIYDKFKNLKEAHKNGAEIEFWSDGLIKWEYVEDPDWYEENEYRIKPKPVLYYRWKMKNESEVFLSDWTTSTTIGSDWIRIEPGKTFEEIK